jgi:alanine-glyoxylate transaminase/serine-glyoxylate transaminase/serine-pyruvate transaminase
VDTSTGVLTDVKSFAKAIREVSPQTLVVVDGVCATGSPLSSRSCCCLAMSAVMPTNDWWLTYVTPHAGAEEFRMDEWDVDVCHTASQKAIGVPPGLAILLASPRAMVRLAHCGVFVLSC